MPDQFDEPDANLDAPFEDSEVKSFAIETVPSDDLGDREFDCHAGVYNNVDDHGDLIVDGSLGPVLPDFLKSGALYYEHDWRKLEMPIGKPIRATEDAKGVLMRGRISKTSRGDDALELMRDGTLGGMSVGYHPLKAKYLSHAQGKSILGDRAYDAALERLPANRPRIRALLAFKDLFDVSLCANGVNREARLLAVKSSLQGTMPFDDHVASVLAANVDLFARFSSLAELRAKEGRTLSEVKSRQLAELRESLQTGLERFDEMMSTLPKTAAEMESAADRAEAERTVAEESRREYARFLRNASALRVQTA